MSLVGNFIFKQYMHDIVTGERVTLGVQVLHHLLHLALLQSAMATEIENQVIIKTHQMVEARNQV